MYSNSSCSTGIGYVNQLTRERVTLFTLQPARLLTPRLIVLAKALLLIVPGWLLFEPALAQVVFQAGERLERQGQVEQALGLYGLAQTLAPNAPRYYRHEANYWLHEAKSATSRERLENALKLYSQSASQNPFDRKSRYQLAYLNVTYRQHLAEPADRAQIVDWLNSVSRSRPWDTELQQRVQVLHNRIRHQSDSSGSDSAEQAGS